MVRTALLVLFAGNLVVAVSAGAAQTLSGDTHFPKTKVVLEKCLAAAVKAHSGEVVKLELKFEKGVPTYEFDIESGDGRAWDIECSGLTGKVTEIEEEVASSSDAKFAAKAKVTEEQARETALARHPGTVIAVEYEIEEDGAASYEFDIQTAGGREFKVEIDATSGKIAEESEEIYQIGKGPNER